jgi:hypothetical protein
MLLDDESLGEYAFQKPYRRPLEYRKATVFACAASATDRPEKFAASASRREDAASGAGHPRQLPRSRQSPDLAGFRRVFPVSSAVVAMSATYTDSPRRFLMPLFVAAPIERHASAARAATPLVVADVLASEQICSSAVATSRALRAIDFAPLREMRRGRPILSRGGPIIGARLSPTNLCCASAHHLTAGQPINISCRQLRIQRGPNGFDGLRHQGRHHRHAFGPVLVVVLAHQRRSEKGALHWRVRMVGAE